MIGAFRSIGHATWMEHVIGGGPTFAEEHEPSGITEKQRNWPCKDLFGRTALRTAKVLGRPASRIKDWRKIRLTKHVDPFNDILVYT